MERVPDDQHDTIVLQHDTVVLERLAPHVPGAPASAPTDVVTSPSLVELPAVGWQAMQPWREITPQQVASAWRQVPALAPRTQPTIVMRNNPAVVGATLGSVALFLAVLPVIGVVAWLIAPLGLLASGIGLVVGMARRVGRVGAIWGICTSGLALVVCAVWTALLLAL